MKQARELTSMIDSGMVHVILVHGMCGKCGGVCGIYPEEPDVFYIWLNGDASEYNILSSFKHELWHIGRGDFDRNCSVQEIEAAAHKAQEKNFYGYFDGVNLIPYIKNAEVMTADYN